MPLPPLIQTTDTFNTWFDATNNLISHVSNTSEYVLVDGATSTGNIAVDGTIATTMLVANGNVVIGGTSVTDVDGLIQARIHPVTGKSLTLAGNTFYVGMSNTVISSTTFTVNPNTLFQGPITVNATTTLSKNTSITLDALSGDPLVVITSNSTINTVAVGNSSIKHFTVKVDSTPPIVTPVSTVTVNSTLFVANASNLSFTGTNLSIAPNTVINGTVLINNTFSVNALTTFDSNVVFDHGMSLGGPLLLNSAFIYDAPELSGSGADTLAGNANASVYRITVFSGINEKNIRAIQTNASEYRQLMLFNNSSANLYFTHDDVGEATATYRILCPKNQPFQIPPQGTALLYYDAAGSVQRWRVISAPSDADASTIVAGNINLGTQTFAGNKTFQNVTGFSANVNIDNGVLFVDAVNNRVGINNAAPVHAFRVDGIVNLNGATNVLSTLGVSGAMTALGTLSVTGAANALGTLGVGGIFTALNTSVFTLGAGFSNTISVVGSATFSNTISTTGNVTFSNTLAVTGNVTFSNTLTVTGNVTLSNTLTVTGNVTFSNTLVVTGNTALQNVAVTNAASFSNTVTITGALTLSNTLGVTGVTTLSNTLGVTGATTLSNTLGVTGATSFSNTFSVVGAATFSRATYLSHIIENAGLVAAAASGTVQLDIATNPVLYYTNNSTGNWTLNLRGNSSVTLGSLLSVGQSITCSFLSTQGATSYYASTIQVDGVSQTVKWQNGIAPSVGASSSSVDLYTFVVIKTSGGYSVFGGLTKFA